MKQTLELIILFVLLFLTSCDKTDNNSYVDKKSKVYDSIYNNRNQEIDLFFKKVKWVSDLNDLNNKQRKIDSIVDESLYSNQIKEIKSIRDTLNLTTENSILINHTSNLTFPDINIDNIMRDLKTNFFISKLSNTSTYSDLPLYWYYYNDRNYFINWKDSIRSDTKKRILSNEIRTINSINEVKYLLVVFDKTFINPKIVSDDYFLPGLLISNLKLYELESKKLVKEFEIRTVNSKKIMHQFLKLPDNLKSSGMNSRIVEDLYQNKNKQMLSQIYGISKSEN